MFKEAAMWKYFVVDILDDFPFPDKIKSVLQLQL